MHSSMDAAEQPPVCDNPVAPAPAAAADEAFAKRGCCGFCIPLTRLDGPKEWERAPQAENTAAPLDASATPLSRRWWVRRGLKVFSKVREWSELVAGPKWKTFIRRFRRNRHAGGGARFGYGRKFGYDPLSYARNFDEGQDSDDEGDGVRRGFSSRYVAPPASTKSSMDLGGRDAPPLLQEGF